MSGETPWRYLTRLGTRKGAYSPAWDELDDDCKRLLAAICTKHKAGENWSISQRDLDKDDCQPGWAICMFLARGLVEVDRDLRGMGLLVAPSYGTIARFNTHGFPVVPKTGDPAVAQPHRPRAINLED